MVELIISRRDDRPVFSQAYGVPSSCGNQPVPAVRCLSSFVQRIYRISLHRDHHPDHDRGDQHQCNSRNQKLANAAFWVHIGIFLLRILLKSFLALL